MLLGGHLAHDNVVPAATLAILALSFIVGHVIAPFGKLVQRLNEKSWFITQLVNEAGEVGKKHTWLVEKDDEAGKMYDWLQAHHPDQGALCAKIRVEFTMDNALAVTFLAVAVMSALGNANTWVIAVEIAMPGRSARIWKITLAGEPIRRDAVIGSFSPPAISAPPSAVTVRAYPGSLAIRCPCFADVSQRRLGRAAA
jgi:hypothetical protein